MPRALRNRLRRGQAPLLGRLVPDRREPLAKGPAEQQYAAAGRVFSRAASSLPRSPARATARGRPGAAEAQLRIGEALAGISEELSGLSPDLSKAEEHA